MQILMIFLDFLIELHQQTITFNEFCIDCDLRNRVIPVPRAPSAIVGLVAGGGDWRDVSGRVSPIASCERTDDTAWAEGAGYIQRNRLEQNFRQHRL
jgi:hypothetical protein